MDVETGERGDAGQILYARHCDVIVIKLVGVIGYTSHWTFPLSTALSAFIERVCAEHNLQNIVVDLTETTGIDSTNLGLLAQIAQLMSRNFGRKPTLITSRTKITKLLHTVGFQTLFTMLDEHTPIYGGMEPIPAESQSTVDVAKMILNAHKTLAEIRKENRLMFANLIEALDDDIAKQGPTEGARSTT